MIIFDDFHGQSTIQIWGKSSCPGLPQGLGGAERPSVCLPDGAGAGDSVSGVPSLDPRSSTNHGVNLGYRYRMIQKLIQYFNVPWSTLIFIGNVVAQQRSKTGFLGSYLRLTMVIGIFMLEFALSPKFNEVWQRQYIYIYIYIYIHTYNTYGKSMILNLWKAYPNMAGKWVDAASPGSGAFRAAPQEGWCSPWNPRGAIRPLTHGSGIFFYSISWPNSPDQMRVMVRVMVLGICRCFFLKIRWKRPNHMTKNKMFSGCEPTNLKVLRAVGLLMMAIPRQWRFWGFAAQATRLLWINIYSGLNVIGWYCTCILEHSHFL